MIRVVLVDDHALIRRGLRETLTEAGGIEVVGEAGSYAELRTVLREVRCEVILLDLNLPGRSGIDVLAALAGDQSPARVVVLSQYPEDQYAIRALRAGAMAYLNKSAEAARIVEAVRTVAGGRKYLTPEVSHLLLDTITGNTAEAAHDHLSEREMQTLMMIASGRRLSEIAEALSLSPKDGQRLPCARTREAGRVEQRRTRLLCAAQRAHRIRRSCRRTPGRLRSAGGGPGARPARR